MKGAAAALALLAALVPAASASEVEFTFSDTFGQAMMDARGELSGYQADQIRKYMDGNKDGMVTQAEADRFVDSAKGLIAIQVARMLTGDNFTLDGAAYASTSPGDLEFTDSPGPTRGGPPVSFHLTMAFLFPAEDTGRHVLRVVGQPTPGGDMHVTLRLPGAWKVSAVEGLSGHGGEGTNTLTFVMPTDGTAVVLTFTGPRASPPFGFALAAGAVVLAAFVRRARQGGT